ncbi:MAG: serine protease [Polyangiaceae bacterium]
MFSSRICFSLRGSQSNFVASTLAGAQLLLACSNASVATEQETSPLIYGLDTRRDLYEVDSERSRSLMANTAMAMFDEPSLVRHSDGAVEYDETPLDELMGICADERFKEQATAATCSGILVTDSLVLTAGHCVRSTALCARQTWAFGYSMTAPGIVPSLHTSDLYRCKSVPLCAHRTDPDGRRWDYAFVELDRPVAPPRLPAVMSLDALPLGSRLEVIGFPGGLPVKSDSDAKLLDPRAGIGDYFALSSDTYDRSSGSGVFDREGLLRGLFLRGGNDYKYRSDLDCFASERVEEPVDPAQAEQAGYLGPALAALCASGFDDERLCSLASHFSAPSLPSDACEPSPSHAASDQDTTMSGCALSPRSSHSNLPNGPCGFLLALVLLRLSRVRTQFSPTRGRSTRQ